MMHTTDNSTKDRTEGRIEGRTARKKGPQGTGGQTTMGN